MGGERRNIDPEARAALRTGLSLSEAAIALLRLAPDAEVRIFRVWDRRVSRSIPLVGKLVRASKIEWGQAVDQFLQSKGSVSWLDSPDDLGEQVHAHLFSGSQEPIQWELEWHGRPPTERDEGADPRRPDVGRAGECRGRGKGRGKGKGKGKGKAKGEAPGSDTANAMELRRPPARACPRTPSRSPRRRQLAACPIRPAWTSLPPPRQLLRRSASPARGNQSPVPLRHQHSAARRRVSRGSTASTDVVGEDLWSPEPGKTPPAGTPRATSASSVSSHSDVGQSRSRSRRRFRSTEEQPATGGGAAAGRRATEGQIQRRDRRRRRGPRGVKTLELRSKCPPTGPPASLAAAPLTRRPDVEPAGPPALAFSAGGQGHPNASLLVYICTGHDDQIWDYWVNSQTERREVGSALVAIEGCWPCQILQSSIWCRLLPQFQHSISRALENGTREIFFFVTCPDGRRCSPLFAALLALHLRQCVTPITVKVLNYALSQELVAATQFKQMACSVCGHLYLRPFQYLELRPFQFQCPDS